MSRSTRAGRAAITVARLDAIEIAFAWRWLPVLLLGTALLGHAILPVRFPAWQPGTIWLTSAAAVLLGEAALLLHELSHALAARQRGQDVRKIVFHGFVAETILGPRPCLPEHEALIARVGPATNVGIACLAALVRAWPETNAALTATRQHKTNAATAFAFLVTGTPAPGAA